MSENCAPRVPLSLSSHSSSSSRKKNDCKKDKKTNSSFPSQIRTVGPKSLAIRRLPLQICCRRRPPVSTTHTHCSVLLQLWRRDSLSTSGRDLGTLLNAIILPCHGVHNRKKMKQRWMKKWKGFHLFLYFAKKLN